MPEQPRIAYLVSHYPTPNHTFLLNEIVALRHQGFVIGVFTIRDPDRSPEEMTAIERKELASAYVVLPFGFRILTAGFVTLFRFPAGCLRGLATALRRGGIRPRSVFFHVAYFLEAVVAGHAIRQAGFRHVHSHFSSTVALIASRIFGFTMSMTIHGPDELRNARQFGMREKISRALFVVAISHYAKSQLMQACDRADWPKIEVCRLGVDTQLYSPRAADRTDEEFRILCVGRLAPVKAHVVLIGACARLIAAGRKFSLRLVGSGPEEQALRNLVSALNIQDYVIFEGQKKQEDVIGLYASSDIFALASFEEGVPVVLMEAMSMEIPCVATWVNGVLELIRPEQEGLAVAPADEKGLAAAIERLFDDSALRRQLGAAGRQLVLARYDLRRNAAVLADVFRRRVI